MLRCTMPAGRVNPRDPVSRLLHCSIYLVAWTMARGQLLPVHPAPASSRSTWPASSTWPELLVNLAELHLAELHLAELHLAELHLAELHLAELLVGLAELHLAELHLAELLVGLAELHLAELPVQLAMAPS